MLSLAANNNCIYVEVSDPNSHLLSLTLQKRIALSDFNGDKPSRTLWSPLEPSFIFLNHLEQSWALLNQLGFSSKLIQHKVPYLIKHWYQEPWMGSKSHNKGSVDNRLVDTNKKYKMLSLNWNPAMRMHPRPAKATGQLRSSCPHRDDHTSKYQNTLVM